MPGGATRVAPFEREASGERLAERESPRRVNDPSAPSIPVTLPTGASSVRRLARALAAFALVGAAATLAGWFLDFSRLTDWDGRGVSQMPNTAISIVVGAVALLVASVEWHRVAAVLGGVVALVGAATLLQHATGLDFGIDRLVVYREWGQLGTTAPGRMGLPGSTSLTLLGLSIAMLAFPRGRGLAVLGGSATIAIALLSLVGLVFGADRLYTIPQLTTIALQTSTMLLALGAAIVCLVPERQPMRTLLEGSAAGLLLRSAWPLLALLTVVLGWLEIRAVQYQLFDPAFGTALLVLLLLGAFTFALWWASDSIAQHERVAHASQRELERLADDLRVADRRKDEFLATLAHELRNPLAPIRTSVELLKRGGASASVAAHAHATIERQVAHLVRLIDDLLDVSRITRDRFELARERVELAGVVRHAVETVAPLVADGGHSLEVALPPEPIVLDADPVRLAQVFANLLSNACRYSERGGRIALSVERDARHVAVTVRDSGIGIRLELLPRIFDMFVQGDRRLERSRGGLGIGLTLVKRLVQMHGGSVEAKSDGPGKGSAFTVRLPLPAGAAAATTAPPPSRAASQGAGAHRVLVVDDNADAAASLALLLELGGHDVRTAADGAEALAIAPAFRPELVLLDLGMPRVSGFEVCRALRAEPWAKGVRIVAVTGLGQAGDRRATADAGFDAHLVKPVDHADVLALLADLPRRNVATA